MGMTFAQKVLARAAGLDHVVPGQIVPVKPDHLLTHDNTAAIIGKIEDDLEKYGVVRKDLSVIVLDHVVPAANEKTSTAHKKVREFVKRYGIENFYDVGVGVCHQVVVEKGHALPGKILVGSDSHTCSYGAVNAFSTGIDRTEAAALMLVGETWFRVPPTIKITLTGKLVPPVSAKDLILTIIGDISAGGATYQAVEFHGNVAPLSIEDRFTIANMGIEMGGKIAVFPCDDATEKYLASIGVDRSKYEPVWADPEISTRPPTSSMGSRSPGRCDCSFCRRPGPCSKRRSPTARSRSSWPRAECSSRRGAGRASGRIRASWRPARSASRRRTGTSRDAWAARTPRSTSRVRRRWRRRRSRAS